ncbi:peptidoglycan-binding protein [Streptomyces sp. NPDC002055]|uniref:peptidoglycan-binding protein n=1 Tax=Streptomyces sp. NPDC002055 TaxID=3154534 RepID=UPI00332695F7
MKRSTVWILLAAATVAAAGGSGWALLGDGGEASANSANPRRPPATTEITRADLVKSKTLDGRLDYAGRRPLKAAVEGTVTKAAEKGATVRMGQRLYEIDARPVILLYGSTPMFRGMKVGTLGPDVLQLERNLRDLGFGAGIVIDNKYDNATKAAVKSWQRSLGNSAPDGKVGQGDVVFQPRQVRVVSADAAVADRVGPEKPVLTIASSTPVVRVSLDDTDQELAKKGTKAEIELPDGKRITGRVSGTVRPEDAGSEGDSGEESTDGLQVEIGLDKKDEVSGGRSGTLSVTFVQESAENVLTVPVEAVVALREGGYGLETVRGRTTRTVRVETGMTADGRIEVSGDGLAEGLTVGTAKP